MVEIGNRYAENAFLGNIVKDTEKKTKIDAAASSLEKVFNPIDDIAKRKVVGDSIRVVRSFGIEVDSVSSLIEDLNDPSLTLRQKENTNEVLNNLTYATYIAMKFGKNEEMTTAIESGSVDDIRGCLPDPLKDLAERVRNVEIRDETIRKTLDKLDKKSRVAKAAGDGGKKKLVECLDNTLGELADYAGDNDLDLRSDDELMRVSAYLGAEIVSLKESNNDVRSTTNEDDLDLNDPAVESYLRDLASYQGRQSDNYEKDYYERRSKLEAEVEQVSLGELLDAYLFIKAPRERAPQLWEYKVPPFLGNMSQKDWRMLLNFQDGWLGAIYDKRNSPTYNNSIDKMIQEILSKRSLEEGDLKKWYDNENLNLKGVMNFISRELLVPKKIEETVPVFDNYGKLKNEKQTREIYVFDTEEEVDNQGRSTGKQRYKGNRVKELVENEANYKLDLAKRIAESKIVPQAFDEEGKPVPNVNLAKLSVAMAMDIMEMGGVFSAADSLRKLSWESDVVRLAQRPERKFTLKVEGGELFAGPWTELANFLSQGDSKRSVEMIKEWGVVPELLAGSFLDQRLYFADGNKTDKTMMNMIYKDEQINFRDLGNDMFFSWRKDHIQPAARMWMYISNKMPLEFSKNRENDAVISQWRADLFNDINQLRKNKDDALLPTSVIEGAIGGSVGLWPFEGPYLRVPGGIDDRDRITHYMGATSEIISQIGLKNEERDQILKFFGVDRKNYKDLNDKIVAYWSVRNVNLPEFYIKSEMKRLFRKRE